jgi:hypothetical protein
MSYLTLVNTLVDSYSDPDYIGGYNSGFAVFSINEVIGTAIRIIDHFGFTSSNDEDYSVGKFSTKTRMIEMLLPSNKGVSDYYNSIPVVDNIDSRINAVLNWLFNNDSNSEFILNLKAIVSLPQLKLKHFGYIAGLVASYNKSTEEKKEAIIYSDSYLGKIKDRIEMNVTLLNIKKIDGYYGVTYLHSFIDSDNHYLVWFGTKLCSNEINSSFRMKATIKDHREYNGIKQTIINRPTF